MANEIRPGVAAPTWRWWLPHFDKLDADDRQRLGRLAQRINVKARSLAGVEPTNTVVLLEAILLTMVDELRELDRQQWQLLVRIEALELDAAHREILGRRHV